MPLEPQTGVIDVVQLEEEDLPDAFWQGIEEFNQGEFYACHDTLEALWMEAMEPEKRFYQGILQIAVSLHHLGNGNQRGATILLGEGVNRLRYYLPSFGGIDVTQLLEQSTTLLATLQTQDTNAIPIAPEQLPQVHRLQAG